MEETILNIITTYAPVVVALLLQISTFATAWTKFSGAFTTMKSKVEELKTNEDVVALGKRVAVLLADIEKLTKELEMVRQQQTRIVLEEPVSNEQQSK